MPILRLFLAVIILVFVSAVAFGQFIDRFDSPSNWVTATGDGQVSASFTQKDGVGLFHVDATRDKLNIWWAIARHRVTGLDMKKLAKPEYELRVEARIRVSHAPRRVNLHVNHQRTTDFHSHLMEFDIPDTTQWHTISMTTRDFDAQPGDSINAHLAMMDWGLHKYQVAFDYFRVAVVDRRTTPADLGNPLPYHPPVADPASFSQHFDAVHDATIDSEFTDRNFNSWESKNASEDRLFTIAVSPTQLIIMRWDFRDLRGRKTKGSGLLELTPSVVQRAGAFDKDFGMVRLAEILSGDPAWDENSVTHDSFTEGRSLDKVINAQMIIDDSVTWNKDGKMLFTISQPVLQRLINGQTKGLAIKPLGAVSAAFLSKESLMAPRLYFEIEK